MTSFPRLLAGMIAAAASAMPAFAEPQESVLYGFAGKPDGANTLSGLATDASGTLYGATLFGGTGCGALGCGTIFALVPPTVAGESWSEVVLYRFAGGDDGALPAGDLLLASDGAIYGTTFHGAGTGCENNLGCGAVFRLAPPVSEGDAWTESVLHRFTGGKGGGEPGYSLAMDTSGALYGVTIHNGAHGDHGTVYRLVPPTNGAMDWVFQSLYSFCAKRNCGDGASPGAGVVFGPRGRLYGTAEFGGASNNGVVWELSPPKAEKTSWTETVIYSFKGGPLDGSDPAGLLFSPDGTLFGVTTSGGDQDAGTIFQLSAGSHGHWTEMLAATFNGTDQGAYPAYRLALDQAGALYGATTGSVDGSNLGTVFKLPPSGSLQTLHTFMGSPDGGEPTEVLLDANGSLYGTTNIGGSGSCHSGCGTVFQIVQ